ncbi:uncharacterized protein LOC127860723 [Dreissena polymorpha]|uniref:Uncharacterized protein n=1 Tax=Dreissena polymorpha TaxID=45954 RepID=A0A9D3YPF1_DREPO|nr:uncharacterized protein LOC127860723 [Dreissena polymorpha]KAH3701848.1 hypothetical protein DPMN_076844 [Dreissena polymorpha]
MQYYDSKSQLDGSDLDSQSAFEMRPWPSHYSSQLSITPSYKSYLSTYTQSQASFFILPVTAETPQERWRSQHNWGFALCSMFINPIFGIVALLLAEMSKDYFNKKEYIQASKYGSYAKGAAMGGIIVTLIVIILIIAQAIHYHLKFNY